MREKFILVLSINELNMASRLLYIKSMMTKQHKSVWYYPLGISFLFLALLGGCTDHSADSSYENGMRVLRIAPLPDQAPEVLHKQYQPLLDYLSKETGLQTELVIANSYAEMLELFHNKKIDLAYFGALTYIKAHEQGDASPLIFRDVDLEFTSVVLVPGDSSVQNIKELKGKSFSFGSKLSTSGHLMPRYYFSRFNIEPESYFSRIEYSGAHDKTAYLVRDKKVDAGVANSYIIKSMYRKGLIKESEIKIIWQTPRYPDYVWASQADIPEKIKSVISNAFLNLHNEIPQHQKILKSLGAGYYVSATHNDFKLIESVINNLSDKSILK